MEIVSNFQVNDKISNIFLLLTVIGLRNDSNRYTVVCFLIFIAVTFTIINFENLFLCCSIIPMENKT